MPELREIVPRPARVAKNRRSAEGLAQKPCCPPRRAHKSFSRLSRRVQILDLYFLYSVSSNKLGGLRVRHVGVRDFAIVDTEQCEGNIWISGILPDVFTENAGCFPTCHSLLEYTDPCVIVAHCAFHEHVDHVISSSGSGTQRKVFTTPVHNNADDVSFTYIIPKVRGLKKSEGVPPSPSEKNVIEAFRRSWLNDSPMVSGPCVKTMLADAEVR